jgi:hypothetical protein
MTTKIKGSNLDPAMNIVTTGSLNVGSISLNGTSLTTDTLTEGTTNLYFTNTRARAAISAGTAVAITSGSIAISQAVATTDNVSFNNLTLAGELRGPATLVIDLSAIGDNTGTVVIKGNLQVDGTTTTIIATTLSIDDKNIVLADGVADSAAADGAGITVAGAVATLTYLHTGTKWALNKPLDITRGLIATGHTSLGDVAGSEGFRAYVPTVAGTWLSTQTTGTVNFLGTEGTSLPLVINSNNNYLSVRTGTLGSICSEQLRVTHTVGATYYVSITGSVSGQPRIQALGNSVALAISGNGANGLTFWSNSFTTQQFGVSHTATAVNYLNATG